MTSDTPLFTIIVKITGGLVILYILFKHQNGGLEKLILWSLMDPG